MKTYPIAPNGIFTTIQGEGLLLGTPMTFVRLAGCSIGCPQCDTDYTVAERLTAVEIRERVRRVPTQWVYVTGGEPADHDLWPLLEEMRLCGKIALATSGKKPLGAGARLVDFLSVSPHGKPGDLVITGVAQLNLVPGLNGLNLEDWHAFTDYSRFGERWVTPLHSKLGNAKYMADCFQFISRRLFESPLTWRLGVQAHKAWGMP